MGWLRVYLALCVVAGHSSRFLPWVTHDGRQAVQVFYIISGFYMALILSGPQYRSVKKFYVSRWLRIFPSYYLVLFLTLGICCATGVSTGDWLLLNAFWSRTPETNGQEGFVLAALTNFTLFGQDWVLFLSQSGDRPLHFTANFLLDPAPLYLFLLVPQMWSVGLEEVFYVIAPVLNRLTTPWIVAVIALSTVGRVYAYRWLGLQHDPFTYRFFPFEISLFLLGVVAFRMCQKFDVQGRLPNCSGWRPYLAILLLLTAGCGLHAGMVSSAGDYYECAVLLSYPVWAIVVVILFSLCGHNQFDRAIGEFSFPIYLCHFVLVQLLLLMGVQPASLGVASVGSSLLVAAVLYLFWIKPVEKWRHKFVSRLS